MWTFIAVLAALAGGAVAGLVADAAVDKEHLARRYLPRLIVGVLLFALVQTWAQNRSQPETSAPNAADKPTSPTAPYTPPPSNETPEPPASSPPPATTTTPEPPTVMAASLLDLTAVAEDTNDSIDLDDSGTLEIDGTTYGRVLVYECSMFCNGSSPQVREVALGKKYSLFTATAAVLDTSTGSHRVDITLDGQRPKTFTAKPGRPVAIRLSVAGISRMRIQLYAPGELKHPIQAGADSTVGRNGGGLPGVGLGDPLLLPRSQ